MKELEREGNIVEILFIRNYKYLFGFISFTTVFFVIYCTYFSLINYETANPIEHEVSNEPAEDGEEFDSFVPNSKCHLPKLQPFDESILSYVTEPDPVICPNKNNPLLFSKTFDSHLVLVDNPMKYGYSGCFYRYLIRQNTSDSSVIFSNETFPITEMSTKIPPEHEFIAVNCSNSSSSQIIDMFPFVPLKLKEKQELRPKTNLNFLILGLDALSHMNFIRVMPKSYKFLTETLKAIGMNGYTKIGDNTFPNIVGALMGMNETEMDKACMDDDEKYFDSCPFIWKNFSSSGYLTSFVEDSAWMSIFNYGKKGFRYSPTTYYTRPMSYMADKIIGSQKLLNAYLCNGPRLSFEVVLNYIQQTAVTMQSNRKNYFQFIWATSLFHDFLNEGKLGDEALLTTLNMFLKKNYFNNTVFILMSDHGARWGDIRSTYQGKVEERMPFLYFVLPGTILNNPVYKNAQINLRGNKERLTTPYDLHETLKDFINLTRLNNDSIFLRSEELRKTKNSRGISLFLPVPPERDCDSAGIAEHWCVCHSMKNIPVANNKVVYEAATHAVNNINKILSANRNANCANLVVRKILAAQEMTVDNSVILGSDKDDNSNTDLSELTLAVNFLTSPGNGSFEATVKRFQNKGSFSWSVLGDISRTNLYGNQSSCVQSYRFKKFCYCLE